MSTINTNLSTLYATNAGLLETRQAQSVQQLSTGSRVNAASDASADLAISNLLTAQINGADQALRNTNNGISMLQVAEGATQKVGGILQRMRELAVTSANGTLGSAEKDSLDAEYQGLLEEANRIVSETEWNGVPLFSEDTGSEGTVAFQVGGDSGDSVSFSFSALGDSLNGVTATSIGDAGAAQAALAAVDSALSSLGASQSKLGATINGLTHAADNLASSALNAESARSRVLDTDFAKAAAENARAQILQQVNTAIGAQANANAQNVLFLLK